MTVASTPVVAMADTDTVANGDGGSECVEKTEERRQVGGGRDELFDLERPSDGEKVSRRKSKQHRRKDLLLKPPGSDDVPIVTIEGATPVPPSPFPRITDENNNQEYNFHDDDKDDYEDFDDDEEDEDAEEETEEEEDKEMTTEEKRDMYLAVKCGDIDLLEDCLDKPNSDITMTWFRENLLMTAIREDHKDMAEFLLDNGVDHTYSTSIVSLRDSSKGKGVDVYEISCRQMAYDYEMFDIVDLIDFMQNQLFPFVRLPERTPRYRRPKPETPPDSDSESGSGEDQGSAEDGNGDSGSQSDSEGSGSESGSPRRRRKKKRGKKKKQSTTTEEVMGEDGEMNKTTGTVGTEADSGHHSLASSKLRIHMVREHERLTEKEESSPSSESTRSRKRSTSEAAKGEGEKSTIDQSDKSETAGSHVRDEGYGSISMKSFTPCPSSPEMKPLWTPVEPSNHFRSTKSALAIRKANFNNFNLNIGSHNHDATSPFTHCKNRPLCWRKVSTVGSYANESKNWHVKADADDGENGSTSVEISQICLTKTSTPSPISTLIPRSAPAVGSKGTPTVSLTSPDGRASSAFTDKTSSSNHSVDNVPSYMRSTKSTVTKQRLTPSFVKSYGGLEFTHILGSSSTNNVGKNNTSAVKPHSAPTLRLSVPHIASSNVLQKRNKPFSFRS